MKKMLEEKHIDLDDKVLIKRALEYSMSCAIKGVINVGQPVRTDYGWEFNVSTDRDQTASLRFTKDGQPSFWELTSR